MPFASHNPFLKAALVKPAAMDGVARTLAARSRCHFGALESRAGLAAIWALYLVPRALILLVPVTPTSDASWYYTRAESLSQGLGYLSKSGEPTAYWPPGWSMALSLAFDALGPSLLAVGLTNLLCGVLIGWLTLDLGRRIFASEAAARTGLLLLAFYPNAIGYFPLALTEVFYTALLLAICWLLVARTDWVSFISAGLLLGVATLVKAQSLAVIPLILGIGLLRSSGWWRQLPASGLRMAALIALAAIVVAPWSLRNYQELHAIVPVSTNGGITLLTGNNDSAAGTFTPEDRAVRALDARGLDELSYDTEAKRLGVEWIKAHPERFLVLMPMKLVRLWAPDGEAQWAYETGFAGYSRHAALFRAARIANQLYYFALLAGFVLAALLIVLRRRRVGRRLIDWWLLPYGIAAYPSAIAMIFSGQSRFHYPAMPFVCMVCGWLVTHLATVRKS